MSLTTVNEADVMREMPATVKRGLLLMELAAREAGRRKHKALSKVTATEMAVVLDELGFKIEVAP